MECPHLLDNINSNSTEIITKVASTKRFECTGMYINLLNIIITIQ